MKKFADFISNHGLFIFIISFLLIIPAIYGYTHTKVNYDVLIYLPEDIETIQGEYILNDDFGLGSFAFVIIDMSDVKKVLKLEDDIRNIEGVNKVASLADVLGTTVPKEILPDTVLEHLYHEDESIIFVTFDGRTSEDVTTKAVHKLRETVDDASMVSSMTSLLIDTRETANREIAIYVVIAVLLCSIVLIFSTNSYIMPLLLLGNIGLAILYNMGTNIFLGQISYITKAISAVLQLGVTTDFSIFLYHKYEQAKLEYSDNKKAMSFAIIKTFQSVIGSSLTTFAGFLALCTMDLTLGKDIGIVMAKGVLFGLVTVLTVFPSFLLVFDTLIEKMKHKPHFPSFQRIQKFSVQHSFFIIILFLVLMIPAYYGNSHYKVYYKLDESLPADLPFHVANSQLAEKFNIVSPEIIIMDKNIKKNTIDSMIQEIEQEEAITFVLAPSTLMSSTNLELLPKSLTEMFENDKYQLVILNSTYEIASDELNAQVERIDKIVKKYDSSAIVAGEGPLMKDLVKVTDHDFHMVNYTSIAVIFVIMLLVLQSFGLPIILIFTIEFAIFLNMACAYYMGTTLPFIASIVVGTIQLGATIDYAILMSTKYLEDRQNPKLSKKEAMSETLKSTVPSIITSALCFFAATVGVAFYTQIDMIGSICTLLSRGSIISMLVVVLILPSLLMLFDGFIMRTTHIKKEVK